MANLGEFCSQKKNAVKNMTVGQNRDWKISFLTHMKCWAEKQKTRLDVFLLRVLKNALLHCCRGIKDFFNSMFPHDVYRYFD